MGDATDSAGKFLYVKTGEIDYGNLTVERVWEAIHKSCMYGIEGEYYFCDLDYGKKCEFEFCPLIRNKSKGE